MKRKDVGTAVGKGAVSGVTKWLVGILLTALVGGGTVWGVSEASDDDDEPTTSQETSDED